MDETTRGGPADATPRFDAYIGRDDVALADRDVGLLRAIESEGSLNAAVDELGRSFAHAHRRIEELEEAFGPLVERRTGGPGGGGSTLTDVARDLLTAFDRLRTEFEGVAGVAETTLTGTVRERDGELATVETAAGEVLALVPDADDLGGDSDNGESDTDEESERVELVVQADAVTLSDSDDAAVPEATSARNRFAGEVVDVDPGETIARVAVDVGGGTPLLALVTRQSCEYLRLEPGQSVVASFKATATRGVPI